MKATDLETSHRMVIDPEPTKKGLGIYILAYIIFKNFYVTQSGLFLHL